MASKDTTKDTVTENTGPLARQEKKALALVAGQRRRQNQFARNNPRLQAALEKAESEDHLRATVDLSELSQYLLKTVLAEQLADPDKVDAKVAGEMLGFIRSEELYQAKIDKIKADTEAVLVNVATPTALTKLFNDFGLCIQRGNEEVVEEFLAKAATPEERALIARLGGEIHRRIQTKIEQHGQEDTSFARIIAAMN